MKIRQVHSQQQLHGWFTLHHRRCTDDNVVDIIVTIVTLTKSVWKTDNKKFDAGKAVSQDTDWERRYASMETWDQE